MWPYILTCILREFIKMQLTIFTRVCRQLLSVEARAMQEIPGTLQTVKNLTYSLPEL